MRHATFQELKTGGFSRDKDGIGETADGGSPDPNVRNYGDDRSVDI